MSGRRVVSGMCASSGCWTIGASTPSTSSRTAERPGSEVSGRSSPSSVAVGSDTCLVCPPMRRTLQLAAAGTAAGVFSGLFGVGGGAVIVPLLILWLGYEQRTASGTSLAAIVVIAAVTAGLQALYGNVHAGSAAIVGLPAVGGVVAGTWLQQRVPVRWLSLAFAVLLVAVAAGMVL